MKWYNHIEAMNTVGMFLGDYGFTNNLITKSAEEHGLIGIGYYLPDGSYYKWSQYPLPLIGNEMAYPYPFTTQDMQDDFLRLI